MTFILSKWRFRKYFQRWIPLFLLFGVTYGIFFTGCGTPKIRPNMTDREIYSIGKTEYDKRHYLVSKEFLDKLVMFFPGSSLLDSAQYYLGKSQFELGDYILGADAFKKLVQDLPNSPLTDDAQFMVAECYFQMSPKYSLDQDYTFQALVQYENLFLDFPNSPLLPEAKKKADMLLNKLAQKRYNNGRQYQKLNEIPSAKIYFELTIFKYPETEWATLAYFRLGESYMKAEDYKNALPNFEEFLRRQPQHDWAEEAREAVKFMQQKLEANPAQPATTQ